MLTCALDATGYALQIVVSIPGTKDLKECACTSCTTFPKENKNIELMVNSKLNLMAGEAVHMARNLVLVLHVTTSWAPFTVP